MSRKYSAKLHYYMNVIHACIQFYKGLDEISQVFTIDYDVLKALLHRIPFFCIAVLLLFLMGLD